MHVTFTTTLSGNDCTLMVNMGEYTSKLREPYQDMLTAAVVCRVRQSVSAPRPLRLARLTSGRTDFALELNTGGISNGERMDAIQAFQDQLQAFIEPVAQEILEMIGFIVKAVAVHEGAAGMSHSGLKEEISSLRHRVEVHYDRVSDLDNDIATKNDALSARLAWVEASLRSLPILGQRFMRKAQEYDNAA